MSEYFSKFIGNVYLNVNTGREWKVVKVKDRKILLRDIDGTEISRSPWMMHNYEWRRWEKPTQMEDTSHET